MKFLSLSDDEFDIINIAVTARLEQAINQATQTEELLRSSNALGYRDMAQAYSKLLATAQNEVKDLQALADVLESTGYQSPFDSEDIPF